MEATFVEQGPRFVGCDFFRHAALGILHQKQGTDEAPACQDSGGQERSLGPLPRANRNTTPETILSIASYDENEYDDVVEENGDSSTTKKARTSLPKPRFREEFWDLPHQVQQVLRCAALISLGQKEFHRHVLEVLASHNDASVEEALEKAQAWGWIQPQSEDEDGWFRFWQEDDDECSTRHKHMGPDDSWPLLKNRAFVLSLVSDMFEPEESLRNQQEEELHQQQQQQEQHLEIGRTLWAPLVDQQRPQNVLPAKLVAQQLAMGSSLFHDQDECYALARLYLWTGETIVADEDDFEAALRWFHEGILLLRRDARRFWHDAYHTSLDLHNAAAEAAYCCGELDTAEDLCQQILSASRYYPNRDPLDNIRASTLLVYKRGTENDLNAAIEQGLSIVKELRVGFPPRGGLLSIPFKLAWVKRRMQELSDEDIMAMPPLTDRRLLGALRIMVIILEYALHAQPLLAPQMAFWMLQVMLTRGMSVMTSDGMAVLGLLCCNHFNEFSLGQRAANLSLKILEKYEGDDYIARCATPVHMFCFAYTKPLKSLLKPMSDAASIGLVRGDIECAFLCSCLHAVVALFASKPLPEAMEIASRALQQMIKFKQHRMVSFTQPTAQFMHNLLGHSADPSVLCGEYMDGNSFLDDCRQNGNNSAVTGFLQARIGIETVLGDFDKAQLTSRLLEQVDESCEPPFVLAGQYQDQAVTALVHYHRLSRSRKSPGSVLLRRRHMRLAKRKMALITRLCRHSDTFLPNLYVVQGELSAVLGKTQEAIETFDRAIQLSKKEDNHIVTGFAQWRAARTLLTAKRTEEAISFLTQACYTYRAWGANVLVDFMKEEVRSNTTGSMVSN